MAEVPFRPARQLSEYKGKGASASREIRSFKTDQNYIKTLKITALFFCFVRLCLLSRLEARESDIYNYNRYFEDTHIAKVKTEQQVKQSGSNLRFYFNID